MDNLENVIEDSLTDAELGPDTIEDNQESVEAAPEAPETTAELAPEAAEPEPQADPLSPPAPKADDFDKRFGLSAQSQSGRENRIPYSRVKKITEKAIADAKKEFEAFVPPTKFSELETKLKSLEPKVSDYEERLTKVAEFEQIMISDPDRFVGLLKQIPVWQEYFSKLAQPTPTPAQTPVEPTDDMPQPDTLLSDGSKVYSMEGLKALMTWNSKQAEDRAYKRIEEQYGPIRQSYNEYQRAQAIAPQVQNQIAEARKWKLFNESEADIVVALQKNPNWSLERAYQEVVLPKLDAEKAKELDALKTDREKLRAEILKELKTAPRSTSATSAQGKVVAPAGGGKRSLEDVIADSVKGL